MAKVTGWTGKLLRVNLSTGKIVTEDTMKYKDLVGGAGIGYKVLFDEVPQGTHPHDEANKIFIGAGPLTGTGAPCSGRTNIVSLLPSNPYYAVSDSHMGGNFGPYMKFSGWDGIIVEGKSDKPVWLKVVDDKVSIEDASHLWGKGTVETNFQLTKELGDGSCVASIGQAGENLVHLSSIVNSISHSGGGHGSILGSKKLKAIAVKGTGAVGIAEGKGPEWVALNKLVTDEILGANNNHVVPSTPQPWAEYSSPTRWTAQTGLFWGAAKPPVETGELPPGPGGSNRIGLRTQKAVFDLGPVAEERTIKMGGCHSCPIRCQSNLYLPELEQYGIAPYGTSTCISYSAPASAMNGKYSDGDTKGKVAMVARSLGARLADDYGVWSNYNLLGKDFQYFLKNDMFKDILPKEEYESIPWNLLEAGDPAWLLEYYRRIAFKEGEFSKLGMGSAWLMKEWNLDQKFVDDAGRGMWSIHGYPKHHSNETNGQVGALINIIWNRDCNSHSHMNFIGAGLPIELLQEVAGEQWGSPAALDAPKDYKPMNIHKAKFAKWSVDRNSLHDSITLCNWMWPLVVSPSKSRNYRGDTALEAKFYSLATGIQTSEQELDLAAERITTMQRALTIKNMNTMNLRQEHDKIPEWVFTADPDMKPFTPGTTKLDRDDMELALDMFYELYGWDKATGAPTRATLERLNLKDVADELERLNLLPK